MEEVFWGGGMLVSILSSLIHYLSLESCPDRVELEYNFHKF